MQLDDDQSTEPRTNHDIAPDLHTLPIAEHSKLLAVLAGLVLHLVSHKESA